MLYRLEIENFYSIRAPQVIDLLVSKNVKQDPERFAHVIDGSELRVPKVLGILGPNGSGKSNVLKALMFTLWFISESFGKDNPRLPFASFARKDWTALPTKLAIEFGGTSHLSEEAGDSFANGARHSQNIYRYELEIKSTNEASHVTKESLRYRIDGRGRWKRAFERFQSEIADSSIFPIKKHAVVEDILRPNASLISTLAQLNHGPSIYLRSRCRMVHSNIVFAREDLATDQCIRYLASAPDALVSLNKELQRIDLGLQEMTIYQGLNGPTASFQHEGLDEDIDWPLESEGTKAFIRRFPLLFSALAQGSMAVIDEIDSSLHPALLNEIIRWFHDPDRNDGDAQLWMTVHNTTVLEELTKHEVVLCDKDSRGQTSVYSLMDVQNIRTSDNLYKKYLGGVYGAVPHVG